MDKYHQLKLYFIKLFTVVLLATGIVESFLIYQIRKGIFVFLQNILLPGRDIEMLSTLGFVVLFALFIAKALISVCTNLLPFNSWLASGQATLYLDKKIAGILLDNIDEPLPFNSVDLLLFYMILLTCAVLIVIPLLIAAFVYSRIVIRKIMEIEAAEHEANIRHERARNLMISDIAHDLRTPITTVSGYAKALSDGLIPDDQIPEYLDAIRAKSTRMEELINLLFDYSKLESEGFSLSKNECDLCEVVRECVAFQYQDIEAAGMEVDVDIPEEAFMVSMDKLQFSRAINNLITNAIRHNPAGTKIGVFVIRDIHRIYVAVADNGTPISEELAENLFDPFAMGDASRTTKGGSGLGLSIVKKVIELHGFTLRLITEGDIRKYPYAKEYRKMFRIRIETDLPNT